LVINFDGLGSSKTTSICDGNYGKIATFYPTIITFNKTLTVPTLEASVMQGMHRMSSRVLEINGNSPTFTNYSPTTQRLTVYVSSATNKHLVVNV
jgi:hypothetical protein